MASEQRDAAPHGRLAAPVRADDHRERALELDGLFPVRAEGADASYG